MKTLGELLHRQAIELRDKVAVQDFDERCAFSYEELDRRATLFARMLVRWGCQKGDRIVFGFGNTPELFVALFGCWRCGAVAVPLDSSLAIGELQAIVGHAEPALIGVESQTLPKFLELRSACQIVSTERLFEEHGVSELPMVEAEDLAVLLYTSGSTGAPKGVGHTHQALLSKISAIARWFGFDSSFTALCLLPTHFGHGLICNCLPTFAYGGTLVIAPPFNLDLLSQLWSLVARHHVSTFSSVPTVVRLLTRRGAAPVASSLKWITCASAPLQRADIEAFEKAFGVPVLNCYGLTETSGWSTCSPNDPRRNLDSVGRPLDCEIRVVAGELRIKGPSVMRGYYKAAMLEDGWFATGDIGEIDETGAVFIHSRIKDLIIRAGKNIYPAEVDSVLMSHPEVADACTVGLDDQLLGEKVAACVVRAADSSLCEAGLIHYAQQKLAAYKCPQHIAFVERIPKSSRGKVNRSSLKSLFAEQRS